MNYGSIPTGPSDLYVRLLKGEISAEDYAKEAKKRSHNEMKERPTGTEPHQAQLAGQ